MKPEIEATLKSRDTEETLDIWFYRPIGYYWAVLCKNLGIIPNVVTFTSIILGISAGIMYYFNSIWLNAIGIFLLIWANSLDSADGQLARMTNQKTRLGRILDGLAGNLWFITIYAALSLRMMHSEGYSWYIFIFAAFTGYFHAQQAAMADYYRNVHLFFIKGKEGSELDNSEKLKQEYILITWKSNFWKKLTSRFYLNYTLQQEAFTKNLQKLLVYIRINYADGLPEDFVQSFRKENKPLMKYTNMLTFNTRAIALFISLFLNMVWLYWVFELTVLNIMVFYMIVRQEQISKRHLAILKGYKA